MLDYQIYFQPERGLWLEFSDPVEYLVTAETGEVQTLLELISHRVEAEHLYAAGWVAYEAASGLDKALVTNDPGGGPLLEFCLYRSVRELPELPSQIPGWSPAGGEEQHHSAGWSVAGRFDQVAHGDAVRRIKQYLRSGDSYQVNYTQKLALNWSGHSSDLFRQMVAAQPGSYSAYLCSDQRVISSVSPELFFSLNGEQIVCRPMKGTAARGLGSMADQESAEMLFRSPKERAENLMVVDMIRNDLGRIAVTGSVAVKRLFELERYPTVWQMTSTVTAQTNRNLAEIFSALFPCASIVGAPKRRTMEIIAELESTSRGVYTGAIGWLAPSRDGCFNVAIRTAELRRDGQLFYGVGGGIVWDSDQAVEAQECLQKARVIAEPAQSDFKLVETLRWSAAEGYWLFTEHLQRLAASADYFDYPLQQADLLSRLGNLVATFEGPMQRVRLTLSKTGEIELSHQPMRFDSQPVKVAIHPKRLTEDSPLRYHKTDPRPWLSGVPAMEGVDDWLLLNSRGELTESTIANLVVCHQGRWITPPLDAGLLPGTYRQRLLQSGRLAEQRVTPEMLSTVTGLALINSVRGWRSAVLVDLP